MASEIGTNVCAINPLGDLYLGQRFLEDNKNCLGNIDDLSDYDDKIAIYKDKFNNFCVKCWAKLLCEGPCPHWKGFTKSFDGSQISCKVTQEIAKIFIKKYPEMLEKYPSFFDLKK